MGKSISVRDKGMQFHGFLGLLYEGLRTRVGLTQNEMWEIVQIAQKLIKK